MTLALNSVPMPEEMEFINYTSAAACLIIKY